MLPPVKCHKPFPPLSRKKGLGAFKIEQHSLRLFFS